MQHLKIGYTDILNMPTNERRFYLGLLVKGRTEEKARIEETQKTSKGKRKSTVSGSALKSKLKSGEIPIN